MAEVAEVLMKTVLVVVLIEAEAGSRDAGGARGHSRCHEPRSLLRGMRRYVSGPEEARSAAVSRQSR